MSKAAIVEQAFGKLQIRAAKGKVRPEGLLHHRNDHGGNTGLKRIEPSANRKHN
ncbi:hypothetical protein MTO98_01910 [Mucilaginibacter sp. SMC90]|jgi:hypothetical protein|uniref:hypothetical protein n=1 Tax=Mucilaginibacter sp. SMC90 TaxID=2929803 RepID=UPI001FB316D0|nr:hypothetical protein [Mucilaginibacter sp. SMC90]UOE49825.1 hypothetical protein MTO98_01910 [Mucilaginibacter sp. SMC90]